MQISGRWCCAMFFPLHSYVPSYSYFQMWRHQLLAAVQSLVGARCSGGSVKVSPQPKLGIASPLSHSCSSPYLLYFTLCTSHTLFSSLLVFYSHHPTSRTCITVISLAYSSLVSWWSALSLSLGSHRPSCTCHPLAFLESDRCASISCFQVVRK